MSKLKMFCLSINDGIYDKIKKLNYIPVGLGDFEYKNNWLRDNTKENISFKNKHYGEYTFHYWFWKNMLSKTDINTWIGFCAQRRFWSNDNSNKDIKDFNDLHLNTLKSIPETWNSYDVVLGNEVNVTNMRFIKILKHGKIALIKNPFYLFKKNRNIKFQFDMFHGYGLLDKAINLLPDVDKKDFKHFVESKNSYNQGNMFICKSREIIDDYYKSIFSWLEKCEGVFGFNLNGYGKQRIYAFLAERYLPYWFSKYTNNLNWPVVFYNLIQENNEK